jgi:hypothetical protein
MRRLVWAAVLSCAFAAAPSGESMAGTYIYPSDDECHACCEVWMNTPYVPFDFYIWIRPDERGMTAAEFRVVPMAGHFRIGTEYNPRASFTLGNPLGPPGISIAFDECIEGWTWIYRLTMMSPNTTPGYYTIEPNDDSGLLAAADCTPLRNIYDMIVYAWFGFNTECGP